LNISGNKLFNSAEQGAAVGKVLGAMLQTNSILRKLDVSNSMKVLNSPGGPWFAQELAVGLRDNGALSSLNLAFNNMQAAGAKHIAQAIGHSQVYCSDGARFEETTLLWGSKCKHCGNPKAAHGNGLMTSLNLASNSLGVEGAKSIAVFLPKCT
jgi:hypothetical protein